MKFLRKSFTALLFLLALTIGMLCVVDAIKVEPPKVCPLPLPVSSVTIKEHIVGEARKAGIDIYVALAIAEVESAYNPQAVNLEDPGSSLGLFQLSKQTAKTLCNLGRPDVFDYKLNTACAYKFIKYQLERYNGDYIKVILAYNAGSYILRDGMPINVSYLRKVLATIHKLKATK